MKPVTFLAAALLAATGEALPEKISNSMIWAREAGHRLVGRATQIPKQTPMLNSQTSVGCFKSGGDLKMNGTLDFNSVGSCVKDTCLAKGFEVGATRGGNQCWCGSKYPPKQALVADKECDVGCTGFDVDACGGISTWSVFNTGKTLSVEYSSGDSGSSSSSSATSGPTSAATQPAQQTVLVTQSAEPEKEKSGGKNTAGIVAGVVVAVIVVASAIGGGLLFLRRKRNKEIEEEHRRNAAVSAFIGKPPSSSGGMSMTDSRMDPVMAHRRMSDGSIADNQDYSRRILRVTNA